MKSAFLGVLLRHKENSQLFGFGGNVIFDFGQLVLVKRYLWGSLAVAILPLLIIAILYDRHSSNLMDRLLLERIEGDMQTAVVKINSFVNAQYKRLENLADLPEINSVFTQNSTINLSPRLLDFLYLEIGDPDIYGIAFYNTEGKLIRAFPSWSEQTYSKNEVHLNNGFTEPDVIQAVLPQSGRPGWFLIKKAVIRNEVSIGTLALMVRLASMTEQASPLYLRGVYEPIIITPNKDALSVVGSSMVGDITGGKNLLIESENFLPGWHIALQHIGKINKESDIGRWLLVIAAISALGIMWLFISMSERLARMITPLNDGAQAIANGDLTAQVPENGPGELGTLAHSFNNMSKQLNSMIKTRVYSERQASLGKLATGIAHEIRNPLATIRTTVHGLIRAETNPAHKEMLQVVNDEVVRTDAIVEEFMNYARPREPHKELIPVGDALATVSTLASASALETNVTMSITGDTSLVIHVDPGQLSQVLMNVVLNALQAMPEGGHLTLRTHRDGKFVHLTITDTGQGIPEEQLIEIQAPFFTTKKNGTGLGLAICAQLVHVNDGRMEIESVYGEGTTVHITFALAT